jgi:hypothetical protein
MENIIIHNPININNRYYRDYNFFWDDLTEELKKRYNVIENRTDNISSNNSMKIYLKKRTKEFLEVMECEYVIEDIDVGDFYILSVADQISSLILDEQNNVHLKKVLYSQFVPDQIVHHTKGNSSKYHPWIYFPQEVSNYEKYYNKRKTIDNYYDELYFKGSTSYRPILNHINKSILCEQTNMNNYEYLNDVIKYKIALSIGGSANGDLCYRDIEYMALGIPFIKFDYVATLNPALFPNYHYISIPNIDDLPKHNDVKKDRLGELKHAKMIEERYKEVINNRDFLEFVSNNAYEYYETYLSKKNRIKHTLKLLNI